jgi:aspartyl-tRNA(Asn)/glutamyl-tRNA(Gln) amidotransferase subunit C
MKLDRSQIQNVARLARLELSEKEEEEFSRQLSDIIEYVEKINQLDTGQVDAADHIVPLNNVFREDTPVPSIERDEIEKTAPSFARGHFVVPRILAENE